MKLYVVHHRHEVAGVFKSIAVAAEFAEKVSLEAKPDPDGLWDKSATIMVKEVATDLF